MSVGGGMYTIVWDEYKYWVMGYWMFDSFQQCSKMVLQIETSSTFIIFMW